MANAQRREAAASDRRVPDRARMGEVRRVPAHDGAHRFSGMLRRLGNQSALRPWSVAASGRRAARRRPCERIGRTGPLHDPIDAHDDRSFRPERLVASRSVPAPRVEGVVTMKVAVLDDYQRVAEGLADWRRLDADVVFFHDHLDDEDSVAARLRPFEILSIMRERTPFPRSLFEKLPNLKLLTTSGMRNLAIDVEAANERGVTVCGTESPGNSTMELTWALMLALVRRIPAEDRATRAGRWQTTLGEEIHGKTLGIVGLARIGSAVARVALAFGMKVLAWNPSLTKERAAEHGAEL